MTGKAEEWCIAQIIAAEETDNTEPVTTILMLNKLSTQELSELKEKLKDIEFYDVGVGLYYSVQMNLHQLLETYIIIAKQYLESRTMDGEDVQMTGLSLSRLLLNLLSMFKSFIDHGHAALKRRFGENSIEVSEWKNRQSLEYDKSSAYRLFCNLRNYSQHVGMPPLSFSFSENSGQDGVSIEIYFDRDKLLSSYSKWSKDAKADLKNGTGLISLLSAIDEWSACFRNLARWIMDIRRQQAVPSAELITSIRKNFSIGDEGRIALMPIPANAANEIEFRFQWMPETQALNVISGIPTIPE